LNEVANFVDAVEELDPLDEFLDSVQQIGDPQDQVSETEWSDMVDLSGLPTPTFEDGYTFYECLETVYEMDDDMGFSDPRLTHNVPLTVFCSAWMQQSLNQLPFGSSFLQDSNDHVIRAATGQHIPFGEPATFVMPVLEAEVGSREEHRVSDEGFYDMMLLSPTALLAEAIPFEGAFPVIYNTSATLAVTGMHTNFTGDHQIPKTDLQLGGMARGLRIAGIGTVHWIHSSQQWKLADEIAKSLPRPGGQPMTTESPVNA
jgi:hypothetical protein